MTTVAYLNTIQIVQKIICIGHSDRRHLDFSVLLVFFRSMTGNYRTTETDLWFIFLLALCCVPGKPGAAGTDQGEGAAEDHRRHEGRGSSVHR